MKVRNLPKIKSICSGMGKGIKIIIDYVSSIQRLVLDAYMARSLDTHNFPFNVPWNNDCSSHMITSPSG
jgi:hypothetical protein